MAEQGPMAIAMRLRNQLQSVYKLDPLRNEEEVKLKIKDLNEHIVCYLCAGYFIDATTITECLHTFCKSCIVKYLQTSKYCPMCNIKIHETQPLLNLKLDRVMQDIVYKLVPGLQESEDKRIKEFYQSRGIERVVHPSGEDSIPDSAGLPFTCFDHSKAHFYRYDEQVSLCLERQSSSLSGKDKTKLTLQFQHAACGCEHLGTPAKDAACGCEHIGTPAKDAEVCPLLSPCGGETPSEGAVSSTECREAPGPDVVQQRVPPRSHDHEAFVAVSLVWQGSTSCPSLQYQG